MSAQSSFYYQEHKEIIQAQQRIRNKTAKYREYQARSLHNAQVKRRALLNLLKNKPCTDCQGWFEPYQLDFDHRDVRTKIANVGTISPKGSIKKLLDEIAKCDLVCANCHRIRTYKQWKNHSFDYKLNKKYVY